MRDLDKIACGGQAAFQNVFFIFRFGVRREQKTIVHIPKKKHDGVRVQRSALKILLRRKNGHLAVAERDRVSGKRRLRRDPLRRTAESVPLLLYI